jgi:3-mercaptopyruvate sulfurtransferase SseA
VAKLVDAGWVAGRLESKEIIVVDPRRPMKYLSGHLPGAINIPMYQAFGADGKLLAASALADFIGGAGLGDSTMPVFMTRRRVRTPRCSPDSRIPGRRDVAILDSYYESWKGQVRKSAADTAAAAKFTCPENLTPALTLTSSRRCRDEAMDFRSPRNSAASAQWATMHRGISRAVNVAARSRGSAGWNPRVT